jgi:uncharacterized protein (DUF427 family)
MSYPVGLESCRSTKMKLVTSELAVSRVRQRRHRLARVPKAIWNDQVIAESADTVVVEGNHYFPRGALRDDVLRDSDTHTICPWKGQASYYCLAYGDQQSADAVWYYPDPLPAAEQVRDRVAFWKDVKVVD